MCVRSLHGAYAGGKALASRGERREHERVHPTKEGEGQQTGGWSGAEVHEQSTEVQGRDAEGEGGETKTIDWTKKSTKVR